jgi:hypothetical protein
VIFQKKNVRKMGQKSEFLKVKGRHPVWPGAGKFPNIETTVFL